MHEIAFAAFGLEQHKAAFLIEVSGIESVTGKSLPIAWPPIVISPAIAMHCFGGLSVNGDRTGKGRELMKPFGIRFGRSVPRFKRLLRLSYLSPAIVEAILAGEQPPDLSSTKLHHIGNLPIDWTEQHKMLGL